MNRGLRITILTITCLMIMGASLQALAQDNAGKVAVVNGTVISQEEFDRAMIPVQESIVASGKPLSAEDMATLKKKVLDNIIKTELLYQECQKNGVKIEDAEINQRYDSEKSKFSTEDEFQQRLKALNKNEVIFKDQIKRQLAIQHLINQKFKPTVTDKDAEAYFKENSDKYKDTTFEAAKEGIKKTMGGEKIADSYNQFYTECKNKAKIETFLK